ncbi:MAG: Alkylhydroperoxidase AhpD core [uncultured Caballeronia sp.]|nr:MAG: Alkylhydroperoxidase AhpD core [uncultured Caballeronia sp.]
MSRLPLQTIESAPEASRPYLEKALANNGFLPNLVASLANAPTALETYLTVAGINGRSGLTLAEREAVQITAVALKKAQLDAPVVESIRDQLPIDNAQLDAVAVFTRAVIAARGGVSDEELNTFRAAGFTDTNALEVVLGVSLATLCNFANNLSQNELNPELAAYRWEPKAKAHAA